MSELLQEQRLSESLCFEDIGSQIYGLLEGTPDSVSNDAAEQVMRSDGNVCEVLMAYVDGVFGCQVNRQDDEYQEPELCWQLFERLDGKAMIIGDQLCTSILSLLQQPQLELNSANAAREECQREFEHLSKKMENAAAEGAHAADDLLSMLDQLTPAKGRISDGNRDRVCEIVSQYVDLRLQEFAARVCARHYRNCRSTLAYVDERVNQFRRQLETISESFSCCDSLPIDDTGEQFNMDRLLAESVEHELQVHVAKTETQVYESLIRERGGYLDALSSQGCWYYRLPSAIRSAAQQVLADAYKKLSLEKVITTNNVRLEQLVKWLNEKIQQARPVIDDCGGASRILIGLPSLSTDNSTLPELMKTQFSVPSASINGTLGDVVICFEGEDVSLASVAFRLLEARPDAIELVKRLHTRNDVDWSTLNDLL